MAEELKDILSHLSKNVSQETLLKYLNDQLSQEQRHEVEKQMIDSRFDDDAIEGLQSVADTRRLALIADALNRDLKKRTQKKRRMIANRQLKPQWWLYFSLLILLILLVLIYIFIHTKINP